MSPPIFSECASYAENIDLESTQRFAVPTLAENGRTQTCYALEHSRPSPPFPPCSASRIRQLYPRTSEGASVRVKHHLCFGVSLYPSPATPFSENPRFSSRKESKHLLTDSAFSLRYRSLSTRALSSYSSFVFSSTWEEHSSFFNHIGRKRKEKSQVAASN